MPSLEPGRQRGRSPAARAAARPASGAAGPQPQLHLRAAERRPVDLQPAAGGLGDPAGDVEPEAGGAARRCCRAAARRPGRRSRARRRRRGRAPTPSPRCRVTANPVPSAVCLKMLPISASAAAARSERGTGTGAGSVRAVQLARARPGPRPARTRSRSARRGPRRRRSRAARPGAGRRAARMIRSTSRSSRSMASRVSSAARPGPSAAAFIRRAGQRRAQPVRQVGRHHPLRRDQPAQPLGHDVERVPGGGQFGGPADGAAGGQVAVAEHRGGQPRARARAG